MQMNLFCLGVCLSVYLFGMYAEALKNGKSGPYETRLTSLQKCKKPKPSYLKDARTVHLEIYNTSNRINLVRGNVTLHSTYQNLMGRAKQYKWVNGKWKLNFVINNDQCNGPIGIFFDAISLKYDHYHCALLAGLYNTYTDPNGLQHALMATTEYGRVLWKIEVFTKTGMLFCYEFDTLVVPA